MKMYLIKFGIWLTVFWALGFFVGHSHPVVKTVTVTVTKIQQDTNWSPLSADQQYACNKFQKDCGIAIAIMRAESGNRHNAVGIDTNSADLGCMQINTSHLIKIDTSNINLLNCQQNIDVAYEIYHADGNSFREWAAYTNGNYRKYLITP